MKNRLWFRSVYSFMESGLSIKSIVNYAVTNNLDSICLADKNVVHGFYKFYLECKKNNIKPLFGIEYDDNFHKILILAKNHNGVKIINFISSCLNDNTKHIKEKNSILEILPKSNDIILIFLKDEIENFILKIRKKCNDIYYSKSIKNKKNYINVQKNNFFNNKIILKILKAIKNKEKNNIDYYLSKNSNKNNNEIIKKDFEEQEKLLLKIQITIEPQEIDKIFNHNNKIEEKLIKLSNIGLKSRFLNKKIPEIYQKRLDYELKIINKKKFSKYILIVFDYIRFAKKNGILTGPGRGSSAGSLICYALYITEIDPIKYNLFFERFLNPGRNELPDIDVDFDDEKRHKIINYCFEKYPDMVAQLITFQKFKIRNSIRDILRIVKINPPFDIDLVIKELFSQKNLLSKMNYFETKNIPILKFLKTDKVQELILLTHPFSSLWKFIFKSVLMIYNFPRNINVHAAGIIITKNNIKNEIGTIINNNFNILTQLDMKDLQSLNYLKMDILGLANLSLINDIIRLIYFRRKKKIIFSKISLVDEMVFKQLSKGNSLGIFQLESPGMINLLKRMKPKSLNEIALVISLFRPGPVNSINLFLKNRKFPENIVYINNDFREILAPTYGIIIYQEQIIQIANKIANFTLSESEILRKALSKKQDKKLLKFRKLFIRGCINNNYKENIANNIFNLIYKFANYGFNKSHAISYAYISYVTAYLRENYFLEFFSCLLEKNMNNKKKSKLYKEWLWNNKKISVINPTINHLYKKYHILDSHTIIKPLSNYKGIGSINFDKIYYIIKNKQPKNIKEALFFLLNKISLKLVINLIEIDFFSDFYKNKEFLLEKINVIYKWSQLNDLDYNFNIL